MSDDIKDGYYWAKWDKGMCVLQSIDSIWSYGYEDVPVGDEVEIISGPLDWPEQEGFTAAGPTDFKKASRVIKGDVSRLMDEADGLSDHVITGFDTTREAQS